MLANKSVAAFWSCSLPTLRSGITSKTFPRFRCLAILLTSSLYLLVLNRRAVWFTSLKLSRNVSRMSTTTSCDFDKRSKTFCDSSPWAKRKFYLKCLLEYSTSKSIGMFVYLRPELFTNRSCRMKVFIFSLRNNLLLCNKFNTCYGVLSCTELLEVYKHRTICHHHLLYCCCQADALSAAFSKTPCCGYWSRLLN